MRGIDPSSYTVFLGLVLLVVAAGAIVVYRLRRDVVADAPVTDDELLRDFERAYYSGEMDEAEFKRVTEALQARKAGIPPAPPPPVEPPAPLGDDPAREARAETG